MAAGRRRMGQPLMPHSEHVLSPRRLAPATPRSRAAVDVADGPRSHVRSASPDDFAVAIGRLADRARLA